MAWSFTISDVISGGGEIQIRFDILKDDILRSSSQIVLQPSDYISKTNTEIRESIKNRIFEIIRPHIDTDNLKIRLASYIGYTETVV